MTLINNIYFYVEIRVSWYKQDMSRKTVPVTEPDVLLYVADLKAPNF